MENKTKILVTTLVGTIVLMALHPVGPFGHLLWPEPQEGAPVPQGWQLPAFGLLFLVEAAASSFGVGYLLFGAGISRRIVPDRPTLATAFHVSLSYLLVQWWPHGNLHMSVPFSLGAILAIDYAFHIPILVATAIVVTAVAHAARRAAERPSAAEGGA